MSEGEAKAETKEKSKGETKKCCICWVLIILVFVAVAATVVPLWIIAANICNIKAEQLAITCTLLGCLTAIIITEIIGIVVLGVHIARLKEKSELNSAKILSDVYKEIL